MKPWLSLSYSLKASLSSLFMVSMSGSSEGLVGDEALVVLVVQPESVLELPLHCLHVRILHQEGGTQLTELSKLNLSGAVLVNLEQQLLELLLSGSEAHGPHDLSQVISREDFLSADDLGEIM